MNENKNVAAIILEQDAVLNQSNYKEIWDKINDLIFVMEIDEKIFPKCFIDSNKNVFTKLGYSKEEFIKIPPSDILNFDENKNVLEVFRNLIDKKCDKVEMVLKSKQAKRIYVKGSIFLFKHNKKKYILAISTDITKNKRLEKQISGILKGVPDVIKVFKADHTIICFNDAGYSFYNKTPKEINGKKCYEVLSREEKCTDCSFEKVIRTKQMVVTERYIPELNKFMDVCCNPVLDENGEILFVVERLRDITEKKILDKLLKDGKERYKQILNNSPDAIVIIVDNIIVLANNQACNLTNLDYNELVGSNVYKHFQEKYKKSLHKIFRNIILQKKIKDTYDIEFSFSDGRLANLQISYSYIMYEGNPAVLVTMRDITEIKQELIKGAKFQRSTLQKSFPAENFVDIMSIYVPANTVSGDFYRIHKIHEDLIIGMVVDVRGKGISAALNISAFDVLFLQEVATTHEPINIVKNLNKKLVNYYEENYIAVCCFSMNFSKNELNVVGAGINQFIFQKNGSAVEEKTAEGLFLGMFENSEFSEQTISFESGDKIFFFTDGLDFILNEDKIIQRYMGKVNINKFKEYIDEFLYDTILEEGTLKDDCTMVAIEIK